MKKMKTREIKFAWETGDAGMGVSVPKTNALEQTVMIRPNGFKAINLRQCMQRVLIACTVAAALFFSDMAFADDHCSQSDIKRVALVILITGEYKQALDCHGREEQCWGSGSPHAKEQFIKLIKDRYTKYPKQLLPDNLAKFFMPYIKTYLSSPDQIPVDVFEGHMPQEQVKSLGTLTVVIRVDANAEFQPPIGFLSVDKYRFDPLVDKTTNGIVAEGSAICQGPDLYQAFRWNIGARIVPLPFDLPADDLMQRIKLYADTMTPISYPQSSALGKLP